MCNFIVPDLQKTHASSCTYCEHPCKYLYARMLTTRVTAYSCATSPFVAVHRSGNVISSYVSCMYWAGVELAMWITTPSANYSSQSFLWNKLVLVATQALMVSISPFRCLKTFQVISKLKIMIVYYYCKTICMLFWNPILYPP